MDRWHQFRESIEDGSMCRCGIPALYHANIEDKYQAPDWPASA